MGYQNDGAEIKHAVMTKYPYLASPDFVVKNTSTYFKPGITWSDVATGLFSARWVDPGYIYADAGPMFFSNENELLKLAYMNSPMFQLFGDLICQGMHYSTGQIPQIPYNENLSASFNGQIKEKAKENIELCKQDWDAFETSWDFKKHPLV